MMGQLMSALLRRDKPPRRHEPLFARPFLMLLQLQHQMHSDLDGRGLVLRLTEGFAVIVGGGGIGNNVGVGHAAILRRGWDTR